MRKLLLLLTLTLMATASWAAKANSRPRTVTQADGTRLTIVAHGDEHFSWLTTTDGVLLVQDGGAFYVAQADADGELSATPQLAHESGQRSEAEQALITAQNRAAFYSEKADSRRLARRNEPLGSSSPAYFPHTGTPTAIVILVNFSDTTFTINNPKEAFDEYLNATELTDYGNGNTRNYASVAEYFNTMSFGQFRPQFDVFGPVTVSNTMKYYGADGNSKDTNHKEMVKEALQLADSEIDFSDPKYDSNNDGDVDLVYIIYAGYGQSDDPSNTDVIWPKAWTGSFGTYDGKAVRRYGVSNELNLYWDYYKPYRQINGIGLFCHEFSHCLGLPDLYPYSSSANIDNQEMEYWSVMDGGFQINNNFRPTAYTAWEREVMGWTQIDNLVDDGDIMLTPVAQGGKAYKFVNENNTKEYMVLESIQRKDWNAYLGEGLLVYHVKYPYNTVGMSDRPNETPGSPGMAVVPADGNLLSVYNATSLTQYITAHRGDTFPGTQDVTQLDYTTGLPNYKWYTNVSDVKMSLSNIAYNAADGTVTARFKSDYVTAISQPALSQPALSLEDSPAATVYSIDGRNLGNSAEGLEKGIYIINNKKVVVK